MADTDYLAWQALQEKYFRACVTGRGLKALSDAIRELEVRLGWRMAPAPRETDRRNGATR